MTTRSAPLIAIALTCALLAVVLGGCAPTISSTGGATASGAAQAGAGSTSDPSQLVAQKCSRCHPIQRVQAAHKDQAGWSRTVDRMMTHGLQVTAAEKSAIVGYLAATYGQ